MRDIGKKTEETKKARIEEEDKDAGRNNIILYRVLESEAETAAEPVSYTHLTLPTKRIV